MKIHSVVAKQNSAPIRAGRGGNLAEQLAIEAKLERLNLSVDPKSRLIQGADASDVRQGEAGLVKAALHTGAPDTIDLGDFSALSTRWKGFSADAVAKLWGGDDAGISKAKMISAAHTLQGIGQKLSSLEEQGFPIDRHKALAELLTKLAEDLKTALDKPTLAYASEKELSALREAFSIFREAVEPRADDLASGLAFQVTDRAFKHAGPEDPGYAKVLATGRELVRAYGAIEAQAKLFEPHPPAAFEAPWTNAMTDQVPASGRTVHDLVRVDTDGGKLELTVGLDFMPPGQYSDDVLLIRYLDPSGAVRGELDSSTWRASSPSAVRTPEGLIAQDTRGTITDGDTEILRRLQGFEDLPQAVRQAVAERFQGLGLPAGLLKAMSSGAAN